MSSGDYISTPAALAEKPNECSATVGESTLECCWALIRASPAG
jgi:hypothetical protein